MHPSPTPAVPTISHLGTGSWPLCRCPPSSSPYPPQPPPLPTVCLHDSQRSPIKFTLHSWAQRLNGLPLPDIPEAIPDAASLPRACSCPHGASSGLDRAPQAATELVICKSDSGGRNPKRRQICLASPGTSPTHTETFTKKSVKLLSPKGSHCTSSLGLLKTNCTDCLQSPLQSTEQVTEREPESSGMPDTSTESLLLQTGTLCTRVVTRGDAGHYSDQPRQLHASLQAGVEDTRGLMEDTGHPVPAPPRRRTGPSAHGCHTCPSDTQTRQFRRWLATTPSLPSQSQLPRQCQSVQVNTSGADKEVQPQGMGCHPGSCLPGGPCFQPSPAQPSREASLGTSRMATQGASGFLPRQMHSGSRLCL